MVELSPRTLLIGVEGLDGSGKSTVAHHLEARLADATGRPVWVLRPLGLLDLASTRVIVDHRVRGRTRRERELHEAYLVDRQLFTADFVAPLLANGHVILNRFALTDAAFLEMRSPGAGMRLLDAYASEEVCVADLTIFLEVPVDVANERLEARGGVRQRHELPGELSQLAEAYWAVVDYAVATGCVGPIARVSNERPHWTPAVEVVVDRLVEAAWNQHSKQLTALNGQGHSARERPGL